MSVIAFADGSVLRTISENAFTGCSSLDSVNFGKDSNLEEIQTRSFDGCTSLNAISLPSSLRNIAPDAFYRCSNLNKITIEEGNADFATDGRSILSKNRSILYCCPNASGAYAIDESVVEIAPFAFHEIPITEIDLTRIRRVGESGFEGSGVRTCYLLRKK